MRSPRHTPVFPAITLTVLVLTGLFTITHYSAALVPARAPSERLGEARAEYVRAGARSRVDWWPLERDAFAQASFLGKPLLVVIGDSGSTVARYYDERLFNDRGVAGFINAKFVPVRIESLQNRGWRDAFLPLTRALLGADPGFQVWAIRQDGTPIAGLTSAWRFTSKFDAAAVRSTQGVLAFLLSAERLASSPNPEGLPVALQSAEETLLLSSDRSGDLVGEQEAPSASFRPYEWLFSPESPATESAVRDLLSSPLHDWLDGGFFERERDGRVEFRKNLAENAAMAVVLARMGRHSDLARRSAQRTLTYVLGEFELADAPAAILYSPTSDSGRSERYSFSTFAVMRALDSTEIDLATRYFGLDAAKNPQMSVRIRDTRAYEKSRDEFDRIVDKLRRARSGRGALRTGQGYMDVMAFSVARCLEAAEILGDDEARQRGSAAFDRWIAPLRAGLNDVLHFREPSWASRGAALDYAAYVDAALWRSSAFPDRALAEDAARVLERAVEVFYDQDLHLFRLARATAFAPQARSDSPQILDSDLPAASPYLARLCRDVGARFAVAELARVGSEALSVHASLAIRLDRAPEGVSAGLHAELRERERRLTR